MGTDLGKVAESREKGRDYVLCCECRIAGARSRSLAESSPTRIQQFRVCVCARPPLEPVCDAFKRYYCDTPRRLHLGTLCSTLICGQRSLSSVWCVCVLCVCVRHHQSLFTPLAWVTCSSFPVSTLSLSPHSRPMEYFGSICDPSSFAIFPSNNAGAP